MTPARKIAAGDVLWYGGGNGRPARAVGVHKVGRSWITTDAGRFDATTMRAEYISDGRLYASEAEQFAERELQEAWSAIRWRLHEAYTPPAGLTLDAIRRAEALLWPAPGDAS